MAYTSADLATVKAAVLALASGSRVERITTNGKTIQYGPADIPQLEKLRLTIAAEVADAANTARHVVTATRKGL